MCAITGTTFYLQRKHNETYKTRTGMVVGEYDFNNLRYTGEKVLIARRDTELQELHELQELLEMVVKKRERKPTELG